MTSAESGELSLLNSYFQKQLEQDQNINPPPQPHQGLDQGLEAQPHQPPHVSYTLNKHGLHPGTVCQNCPNAVWHIIPTGKGKREHLRVYCKLMFSLIDAQMLDCDGNPIDPDGLENQEQISGIG